MEKTMTAGGFRVATCKCGGIPMMIKIALHPPLWKIRCSCGRTGLSECNATKAVLNWNSGYLKVG